MLQIDTSHPVDSSQTVRSSPAEASQYAGNTTEPNPLLAAWSPLHEFEGSTPSDARMAAFADGSDAVAELEAGRASIARLRSALMDTLDDMQGMVAGVKQYDRALCTMLARIDRAKAALTHDVIAADSVMERVDRRTS